MLRPDRGADDEERQAACHWWRSSSPYRRMPLPGIFYLGCPTSVRQDGQDCLTHVPLGVLRMWHGMA
eukprot:2158343-Rhodomonas_salina.1